MEFSLFNTSGSAARTDDTGARKVKPRVHAGGNLGTVKAIIAAQSERDRQQIVLGNTFHLWLRPGTEVIAAHDEPHRFMGWDGPILTDSGVQFSLGEMRRSASRRSVAGEWR